MAIGYPDISADDPDWIANLKRWMMDVDLWMDRNVVRDDGSTSSISDGVISFYPKQYMVKITSAHATAGYYVGSVWNNQFDLTDDPGIGTDITIRIENGEFNISTDTCTYLPARLNNESVGGTFEDVYVVDTGWPIVLPTSSSIVFGFEDSEYKNIPSPTSGSYVLMCNDGVLEFVAVATCA